MTHYLIDGYNWLFGVLRSKQEETLQIERERIIREISSKLSTAGMTATIVFDSQYNPGPAERLMSKGIPIYFTDEGQTADEYIVEFMKYTSRPQDYTIVTTDNRLALAVRHRRGHSISIKEFKKMLDRISHKKQNPRPKTETPIKHFTPMKTLLDHYEELFTKGIEESPPSKPLQKQKAVTHKQDAEMLSDFERWQKIFEENQ